MQYICYAGCNTKRWQMLLPVAAASVNKLQALNRNKLWTSAASNRERRLAADTRVRMSAQSHSTSRAGNFTRRAPPLVGPDRASQTFRFPPHSQAQGYPHNHHQPAADDTRPSMDSVLHYPQYAHVHSQDRRRPDEQSSSSSSSPLVHDRSPADSMNANRKRLNSAGAPGPARKKARKDDEADESASPGDFPETKESKPKSTRGARYVFIKRTRASCLAHPLTQLAHRACTVCRRLKMRCEPSSGTRCKRCETGNHECIFEESNRGKRSSK